MADPIYCIAVINWPCATGGVWAAWTQALLSAAAIYAASRLATRQERVAARRRADACVGLITHAQDVLAEVLSDPTSRPSVTSVETLARQLAEVPMDSAPDFRLVVAVRQASSIVSVLAVELAGHAKPTAYPTMGPWVPARRDIRTAQAEMEGAYNLAIEAANELQSPSLAQRWRRLRLRNGSKDKGRSQ